MKPYLLASFGVLNSTAKKLLKYRLTSKTSYITLFTDVLFTQSVVIPLLIRFLTPIGLPIMLYLPIIVLYFPYGTLENAVEVCFNLVHAKDNKKVLNFLQYLAQYFALTEVRESG